MINKIRRTIERHGLLRKGDRVLAAVSGGPDSVALLKILKALSDEGYDLSLAVAHLNHGLRGNESDHEEMFVSRLSASMAVPFFSRKADIAETIRRSRGSLEDACRKERYAFLDDVRDREGMDRIALGHHLDDQAETVLMRLLRGSGPEGLKGMVPLRDGVYIRPLIEVTRREILAFLDREGTAFVEDSSNESDIFLRNRIRRHLLPALMKDYNPRLVEHLGRTAEILRMEDDYIQGVAEDLLRRWIVSGPEEAARIPLDELLPLHEALIQRIFKKILLSLSPLKNGIGHRHVDAVMSILKGDSPNAAVDLPFHVRAGREYGMIYFERKEKIPRGSPGQKTKGRGKKESGKNYRYAVEVPGDVDIPEWGKTISFRYAETTNPAAGSLRTVFIDPEKIHFPMALRNWVPGDRMEPLGMEGKSKKVQDIFVNEKVPRRERMRIPLLVDRDSVIWIPGLRLSGRVRVTDQTARVLKIEIN